MILLVKERLILLSILPHQGNIITLKIMRKLREQLSFSEEEHKILNLQYESETDRVKWDAEKAIEKGFNFNDVELDIIKSSLRKLNDKGELHEDFIDLYDKFIP